MEEGDDASEWRELESADEAIDMWLDALRAGTKALIGYAPDERIGPREVRGDDEDAAPLGFPSGWRQCLPKPWCNGKDALGACAANLSLECTSCDTCRHVREPGTPWRRPQMRQVLGRSTSVAK